MIIAKPNPIGIDKVIDTIQTALFDGLMTNGPFTDYTVYHRAYQNESDEGIKAERYTNSNEYRDVFLDDKQNLSSFFIVDDDRPAETIDSLTASVSVIFQARLDKLYNNITERADEELNREIYFILNGLRSKGITFVNFVQGISNVYAEFDQSKIKWTDMHPFYVVRFNLDINSSFDCSIVVDGPPPECNLSAIVTVENETSLGANDGTAIATPVDNVGGVTFSWTGPSGFTSTQQGLIGLAAGVYTVIIRDIGVASCTATDSGTVSSDGVGCVISIDDIVTTAPLIVGGSDGTATATVSGEVGAIAYLWSNGETTNPAVNLPTGFVCLTVLDLGLTNCIDMEVAEVPVPIAIVFTSRRDSSATFTVVYSGTGEPEWTSIASTDGTEVVTGLAPTFTSWATVEDHVVSVVVDEPENLTAIGSDWENKTITAYDFSPLIDFGDVFAVGGNDIVSAINPIASLRPYTRFDIDRNDIVTMDMLGIILGGSVDLDANPVTSIAHGPSTELITNYSAILGSTLNTPLDVSPLSNLTGTFRVRLATNLPSLTVGTSPNNFGDIRLDASSSIGYTDFTGWPNMLKSNNGFYHFINMSLSSADINHYLVDFAAHASSEGAGGDFAGRVINMGNNSGSPDNSSGGFDGLAAIVTLVSFGITVNT